MSQGISWPALNQTVCALRFFYGVTLNRAEIPERIAYTLDSTRLSFGPAASTMMACPPPLDELEQALGTALKEVREFTHDGASLPLLDDAGQPVMQLTAVYHR